MASRRNRNSSRYLGTITKTQLDQAAVPVGYVLPGEPLPAAIQAEVDAFMERVATTEAKMARLGFTHRGQLAEFEAQMGRKDRQLDAEAKTTGPTWMGTR